MKIGILTFHKPINYGAFLQSFALSNALSKKFRNSAVEIIDYIAPQEKRKITINLLWGVKHYGLANGIKDLKKIRAFHAAYATLPLSAKKHFNNLTDLFQYIDSGYDFLVIGSDAVFNWNQNGYPTAFIPTYHFKYCKIVSYAASVHGLKYLAEPQERLAACGQTFENMPIVGVRDFCTEQFVRACCPNANVVRCCDPTATVDLQKIQEYAGAYEDRIAKKFDCRLSKKYMVLMLPDSTITRKIYDKYASTYQIVTLFKPSNHADYYLYDLNPFEWAAVLSKAQAVITSYFHGAMLSLKHNTPVVAVDFSNYNPPYEGKLHDLLHTEMNLPELYFNGNDIETEEQQNRLLTILSQALNGEFNNRIAAAVQHYSEKFLTFCGLLETL